MKTYPISVSNVGLHIRVDDILTPVEAQDLIRQIMEAEIKWHKLTREKIDGGKPR